MRVLSGEKTVTDKLPHCNAHGLIMTLKPLADRRYAASPTACRTGDGKPTAP